MPPLRGKLPSQTAQAKNFTHHDASGEVQPACQGKDYKAPLKKAIKAEGFIILNGEGGAFLWERQ